MSHPTNNQRAAWARTALDAFGPLCFGRYADEMRSDPETPIKDLICDLLHLADSLGLDPEPILSGAWDHYICESESLEDED